MLHVACAADRRYAAHSAAMVHSLLEPRQPGTTTVHYLHSSSFPRAVARDLGSMVSGLGGKLNLLAVDERRIAGLPRTPDISHAMWYRTLLPEMLPDVPRVLYLDVDVIVIDSLDPLWETDLDGCFLAAVTNVLEDRHLSRPVQLGLAGPTDYFNSGVLLMNLELMREESATARLHAFAREHQAELLWPDQDALNVVLGDRRRHLAPRWNFMSAALLFPSAAEMFTAAELEEARRRPAIRHFEGPQIDKPWHYLCEHEMRELYAQHRAATPWPRFRPAGRTPGRVLHRFLRQRRVGR
ncbi:MAG: glycosyltransferase family 8 protein [Solirubrobacteraceae bacterium]